MSFVAIVERLSAMAHYENAVWILLIEWCFFRGRHFREILIFGTLIMAPLAFMVAAKAMANILGHTLRSIALDQYWLSQGPVLAKYLALTVWPAHQALIYDSQPAALSWTVLVQWNIVLIVLVAGLFTVRRRPLIGFGILSFFVLLLPVMILPLPDLINEHRMYLPLAGLAMAATGAFTSYED